MQTLARAMLLVVIATVVLPIAMFTLVAFPGTASLLAALRQVLQVTLAAPGTNLPSLLAPVLAAAACAFCVPRLRHTHASQRL